MLVNCVAYEKGKKVADVALGDIGTYLTRPDSFVWVAVKEPGPDELAALQKEFSLHALAVEDAHHGHQQPKLEEYAESLFVVMHIAEWVESDLRLGELAVFVGTNYVVSVRRGGERGFQEVRTRSEQEPHLLGHGPAYVLYALMDAVVDRYAPIVEALSLELEGIEERIFEGKTVRANIEELYGLKQKLMRLKHATGPLLDVTGKLFGGRVPALCSSLQDYFRDIYDHVYRINQDIDSLREMATTALSVNLSLITIQENEVTKRLASYAALIAVPTMIVGVYGMNFEHMPELTWKYGYPVVLAIMAVVDVVIFYRLRKAKWL